MPGQQECAFNGSMLGQANMERWARQQQAQALQLSQPWSQHHVLHQQQPWSQQQQHVMYSQQQQQAVTASNNSSSLLMPSSSSGSSNIQPCTISSTSSR